MSIQSTSYLTREQAEDMYLTKVMNDEDRVRLLKAQIILMTDSELEDGLESQFDNYCITSMKEKMA